MQIQRPGLIQEQKLKMTPQLIQSMKILTLPLLDLKARIQEELEANPALEVLDETANFEEPLPSYERDVNLGYENSFNSDVEWDDDDPKRRFLEGALSRPESLQEHLLWQLRLQPIPEELFQLGELIIRNLNDHGFHREPLENLLAEDQLQVAEDLVAMIQAFDPLGCATADYQESLLVQARLHSDTPPHTEKILKKALDLLERGKLKEIRELLGVSDEIVERVKAFLSELNPYPGLMYSQEKPQYVIPDVEVRRSEGDFVIIINDEEIPPIGINPFFDEVLKGRNKKDQDLGTFVQQKMRDARWFIQSVQMRNDSLIKVVRSLIEFQRDFFLKGPKALVPLTRRDLAAEVGLHETTISRIANKKYIQTDWGIFELKFFFSQGLASTTGTDVKHSKQKVLTIIAEILEAEGKKRLSDQKISDLLLQRGIKIARRTVTKYRKELDVSSSFERP